jgi:hypothetical protein
MNLDLKPGHSTVLTLKINLNSKQSEALFDVDPKYGFDE